MEEKDEIQKRLENDQCPWCMQALKIDSDRCDEEGFLHITRKCVQCGGSVTDIYKEEFTYG